MKLRFFALGLVALAGCGGDDGGDDGGGDDGGGSASACPAISRPKTGGTEHETLSGEYQKTDEVWKAEDSPHIVGSRFWSDDAHLTIEPCSYVIVKPDNYISFLRGSKLTAIGTADKPIVFDSQDSEPWANLATAYSTPQGYPEDTQGGFMDLAYVTLINSGSHTSSFGTGSLEARGNDVNVAGLPPTEHIRAVHVTVDTADDWGFYLDRGASFTTDSTDLIIKDAKRGAGTLGWSTIDLLPTGDYGDSFVEVYNDISGVRRTMTVHDRGVPYQMGFLGDGDYQYYVGASEDGATTPGTLTIEPGVEMQFGRKGSLVVYKYGTLKAVGTATKPIRFTSFNATKAAGDWVGIQFDEAPAGSQIDHAEVLYAGSDLGFEGGPVCPTDDRGGSVSGFGAIGFNTKPATQIVTNTTISHSLHDGITRGWDGGQLLDFTPTNTFSSLAGCKQSRPYPTAGACPQPPDCATAP